MAFIFNGTNIAQLTGRCVVNGIQAKQINVNNSMVWFHKASPIIITSSTTLTAGTDFPANTTITVQVMGGGGSGGGPFGNYAGGGGGASSIASTTTSKSQGQTLSVTIGSGGAPISYTTNDQTPGNPGGTSTCIVSKGGGGGGCGGCLLQADGGAGASSSWGSGGGSATAGGVGAGGGGSGNYYTYTNSGAGGRGEVRLSW